jgi:acyl carrier protein
MKTETSREIVREFVVSNLVKKREHLGISDQDNIIIGGILDSLGIIKTINFLEEKYKFLIKDEDVLPENFESIEAISSFVDRISSQ